MARRNRFANVTGVARMDLTDGDWIELKEELSVGDQQLQHFLLFTIDPIQAGGGDTKVGIRPRAETALVAELAVALVGWSFEDEQGPVTLAGYAGGARRTAPGADGRDAQRNAGGLYAALRLRESGGKKSAYATHDRDVLSVALATGWAPDVIEDLPAHRYRLLADTARGTGPRGSAPVNDHGDYGSIHGRFLAIRQRPQIGRGHDQHV